MDMSPGRAGVRNPLLGPLCPALFIGSAGLAVLAQLEDFVGSRVDSFLGALAAMG